MPPGVEPRILSTSATPAAHCRRQTQGGDDGGVGGRDRSVPKDADEAQGRARQTAAFRLLTGIDLESAVESRGAARAAILVRVKRRLERAAQGPAAALVLRPQPPHCAEAGLRPARRPERQRSDLRRGSRKAGRIAGAAKL